MSRSRLDLHRFANPGAYGRLGARLQPLLTWPAIVLTAAGLVWGLFLSPADWQQGDAVRIMYVHVPAAWLACSGYAVLAGCALVAFVWRHPLADLAAAEIAPVGATVTAICLATGALWGRPIWGAWWAWDARLSSVLVLLFFYAGYVALSRASNDPARSARAAAVLAVAGLVDLPVIKFSVQWWNTLHQPDSITLTAAPTMPTAMLAPLLVTAAGFTFGFAAIVNARLRAALIEHRLRARTFAAVEAAP